MSRSKIIPAEHLKTVCKFGQGDACCAYILGGSQGFECGKKDELIVMQIEMRLRLGTMKAKGNNCLGYGIVLN